MEDDEEISAPPRLFDIFFFILKEKFVQVSSFNLYHVISNDIKKSKKILVKHCKTKIFYLNDKDANR